MSMCMQQSIFNIELNLLCHLMIMSPPFKAQKKSAHDI